MKVALGIKNEENLENIRETAKHFVKNDKEFLFDAEHFFDGYKNNPNSILDIADIVFVNPVNTAYSRILEVDGKKADREKFF